MKPTEACIQAMQETARQIRRDGAVMMDAAGGGHYAPALSCADIIAVLYEGVMRYDPQNPKWEERDRFILSKGHAVLDLYSILAQKGFYPHEDILQFKTVGSPYFGHPPAHGIPGIDFPSGSMGHGIALGAGMAIAGKMKGSERRVFVLTGDGELNEGLIWESVLFAPAHQLDNLTVIVDRNGFQHDAGTEDVLPLGDIGAKFEAFGWHVRHCDGHNVAELYDVLTEPSRKGCPTVVVAKTVKGKGISFIENDNSWHSKSFKGDQFEKALTELDEPQGGV